MAERRGQNQGSGRGRSRGRGHPDNQPWQSRRRSNVVSSASTQPISQSIHNATGPSRGMSQTRESSVSIDARRRMNLMASVSRSSGLEKDGDE